MNTEETAKLVVREEIVPGINAYFNGKDFWLRATELSIKGECPPIPWTERLETAFNAFVWKYLSEMSITIKLDDDWKPEPGTRAAYSAALAEAEAQEPADDLRALLKGVAMCVTSRPGASGSVVVVELMTNGDRDKAWGIWKELNRIRDGKGAE